MATAEPQLERDIGRLEGQMEGVLAALQDIRHDLRSLKQVVFLGFIGLSAAMIGGFVGLAVAVL